MGTGLRLDLARFAGLELLGDFARDEGLLLWKTRVACVCERGQIMIMDTAAA